MWRALAHRNYRLYFGGQGISLIGTWMTRVATGWLVYRLSVAHATNPEEAAAYSAFLLGIVGFAGQFPSFLMGPFAGALVDRWNRHQLLVVTQALSLIQSALLAVVAFYGQPGVVTMWEIILLSIFQGLINAFDMPGRQAFLVEMITRKEDLANAIALNSSLVNGARLIGPSVAGVLIALTNEGWCFVIDAVSYLAVIAALLAMQINPQVRAPHRTPLWHGIKEGFTYTFGFAPIRDILLLLGLVSFMGMPYSVLMPIFAADILHGGPNTLGFLMTASGVGALIGALYLAWRNTVLGLGRIMVLATLTFGIGLIGFALSRFLGLSLLMLMLVGGGMMVQMAASNTILQTIVEENKRGRVMSFYVMAFMGMAPFGSLFGGGLARAMGAPKTVLVGGIACMVGALLFALKLPQLRTLVRPLYIQMGLLPEVVSGIQSATALTLPPEE
ncbi:MAG: MFS transporter [Planctomycetes bacterium]|nr:MFS transporter [Planctomycetota bacterium]